MIHLEQKQINRNKDMYQYCDINANYIEVISFLRYWVNHFGVTLDQKYKIVWTLVLKIPPEITVIFVKGGI